jgi:diguanylate cyclase (GGDEF)-like protein
VDSRQGIEYLLVPRHGDDHDLDPGLLTKKVHEMLSGRKQSVERNPVTDLPGAAAFEAELRERISTGERFGVVFADLNQFKYFNKAYSYSRGDEMLCALGSLMQAILDKNPHPQNFLAHLGSDDFALITSEKQAQMVAELIVDRFDEMVSEFYDVADLSRGSVIITDRKAREYECPIVTIALAVILSSRNAFSHAAEALDIADELLDYLKSRDVTESCCIVERKSAE